MNLRCTTRSSLFSKWSGSSLSRSRRRIRSARPLSLQSQRCFFSSNNDNNDDDSLVDHNDYMHPALAGARMATTHDHLYMDRMHLWHPYTSLVDPTPVLPVSRAVGCHLVLETQSKRTPDIVLLDGMSSWWAAVWGYNHPTLNQALEDQMHRMSHVMFGGLTHRPATELATLLLELLQQQPQNQDYAVHDNDNTNLDKIFYTDSGSVAVEVALKMAWQYQRGTGQMRKTKILSVRGGYHGDTLGAMSVCDPVGGMHAAFASVLPPQVFVTRPPCHGPTRLNGSNSNSNSSSPAGGCHGCTCGGNGSQEEAALQAALNDLQDAFNKHHESLAAMILEPVVQGAGGMRFYSPRYLQRARELCTEYNVLLICDEIATGFGRSGSSSSGETTISSSPFASLEAGVQPDILCLGKALTAGYMTLGAVVTTQKVAYGVSATPPAVAAAADDSKAAAVPLPLMHGPTFMGNPLACAVAVASTNMMLQPDPDCPNNAMTPRWSSQVQRIQGELRNNLQDACDIPGVADVRVQGAIGVVELEQPLDNKQVPYRCCELGVWLRPFGKLLYTMPPYIMTNEELKRVTDAMLILAEENGRQGK